MKEKYTRRFLRLLIVCLCQALFFSGTLQGQEDSLEEITTAFNEYAEQALQEKIYAHTDRSFYLAGETVWFKLYCVDGALHKPLNISKVAYVEIVSGDSVAALQTKVELKNGMGSGFLFLPASLNSGAYTFRVYTNWMKNFDPEFFFHQPLKIVNTFKSLSPRQTEREESERYLVQFFPEGGDLVAGLESKVAFRGADATGKGIFFNGTIINRNGDTITTFRPHKFGIGHFYIKPRSGENLRALITAEDSVVHSFDLPEPRDKGYVMHLEEKDAKLELTVKALPGSAEDPYVYLLAQTRQVIAMARVGKLDGGVARFEIDKEQLGPGISPLTIFDRHKRPVAERLYFKKPEDALEIKISAGKAVYQTREKVDLNLATQHAGLPEAAGLSVSVYRLDSLNGSNQDIFSYLWLTSDLKGDVESPEYYFNHSGPEVDAAIDNLMLTHGWRRFAWEKALSEKTVYSYAPEYGGHIVNGRIIHPETGNPIPNMIVYLSSPGRDVRTYVDRSDKNGAVNYELKGFYGSKELIVNTNPLFDTASSIEILSPFSDQFTLQTTPGFELDEKFEKQLLERSIHMQTQNVYYRDENERYIYPEIDSSAFYGKPDQLYRLDDYTRFTVMEEVMREYVSGVWLRIRKGKYHFMALDEPRHSYFQVDPLILIDGVPVFDADKIIAFDPLNVERLEVITRKYHYGPLTNFGIVSYITYDGDLAGFPIDPRTLIVEYEGMQVGREFFSPGYDNTGDSVSRLPDFRNLLFWSPDLTSGNNGEAVVEFFTSEYDGVYKVVAQGVSENGAAGFSTFTFEVKSPHSN